MSDQSRRIDLHVGDRLKFFRVKAGLSQQAVARQIGVSFQQIQKYEKGTNRISASKLYEFTRILGCAVQDFFAGIGDTGKLRISLRKPSRIDYEILTLLGDLSDNPIKRQVRALLTAIIEPSENEGFVSARSAGNGRGERATDGPELSATDRNHPEAREGQANSEAYPPLSPVRLFGGHRSG